MCCILFIFDHSHFKICTNKQVDPFSYLTLNLPISMLPNDPSLINSNYESEAILRMLSCPESIGNVGESVSDARKKTKQSDFNCRTKQTKSNTDKNKILPQSGGK